MYVCMYVYIYISNVARVSVCAAAERSADLNRALIDCINRALIACLNRALIACVRRRRCKQTLIEPE
jgi:hypothetical protein